MYLKQQVFLGLSICFVLAATTAQADEIVSANNPDAILNIARGLGSATLGKSSKGNPKITGRIEGDRYYINFGGCKDGKDCDYIQFGAGWSGFDTSLADVNKWNSEKSWSTAHIDDEGDPILQMSVNLDYGVTVQNLEDSFSWWNTAFRLFNKEVTKK